MLYIVNKKTSKILKKIDGWDENCIEKAFNFITSKGYYFIEKVITFSGDMVLYVV